MKATRSSSRLKAKLCANKASEAEEVANDDECMLSGEEVDNDNEWRFSGSDEDSSGFGEENVVPKCKYELIREEIIKERKSSWEVQKARKDIEKYKVQIGLKDINKYKVQTGLISVSPNGSAVATEVSRECGKKEDNVDGLFNNMEERFANKCYRGSGAIRMTDGGQEKDRLLLEVDTSTGVQNLSVAETLEIEPTIMEEVGNVELESSIVVNNNIKGMSVRENSGNHKLHDILASSTIAKVVNQPDLLDEGNVHVEESTVYKCGEVNSNFKKDERSSLPKLPPVITLTVVGTDVGSKQHTDKKNEDQLHSPPPESPHLGRKVNGVPTKLEMEQNQVPSGIKRNVIDLTDDRNDDLSDVIVVLEDVNEEKLIFKDEPFTVKHFESRFDGFGKRPGERVAVVKTEHNARSTLFPGSVRIVRPPGNVLIF